MRNFNLLFFVFCDPKLTSIFNLSFCVCVSVFVCVFDREIERERESFINVSVCVRERKRVREIKSEKQKMVSFFVCEKGLVSVKVSSSVHSLIQFFIIISFSKERFTDLDKLNLVKFALFKT